MKPKLLLLISLLIIAGASLGQNHILKGNIYFQSSGFLPAENVAISGDGADQASQKPTGTHGDFELKFANKAAGDVVHLSIGGTALHNQPIEIVNEMELEKIVIPNDPNQRVSIIVCPKGQKEEATMAYYHLIKNSLARELSVARNQLALALRNVKTYHRRIEALNANIKELQGLDDPLIARKAAEYIATINKDVASPRVLQYLKLLEQGKSIREALKSLNLTAAITNLQRGGLMTKQADEEIRIYALDDRLFHKYKQAALCYSAILTEAEYIGSSEVHGWDYIEYLYTYLDGDHLHEADSVSARLTNWLRKYSQIEEWHKVTEGAYEVMGTLNRRINSPASLKKALDYDHKGLALARASDDVDREVEIASNMGLLFKELDEPDSAKFYLYHSYDKFTPALQAANSETYVTVMNNIGQIECEFYKNDTLAIRFFNLALQAAKRYKVDSLYFAMAYDGLGNAYHLRMDTASILKNGLIAVAMARRLNALQYLTDYLFDVGQNISTFRPKEALKYLQENVVLERSLYPPTHPGLGAAYYAIGEVYYYAQQPDSCYKYFMLAMKNRADNYHEEHGEYDRAAEAVHLAVNMMCDKYGLAKTGTNAAKLPYYNGLIASNKTFIFWRGAVFLRQRRPEEALEDLKASLSVTSQDFQVRHDVYQLLAIAYDLSNDYDQAIAALDKALATKAETETFNLALKIRIQFQFEKTMDAEPALARYENLNPNDTLTYRNWAIFFGIKQDRKNTLANLHKALAMGLSDFMWLRTEPYFSFLKDDDEFKQLFAQTKR